MIIKKTGGKVFGAQFTAAERKAIDLELRRSFAEIVKEGAEDIDSTVLWVLHTEFGFGEKRLKKFYDIFLPKLMELTKYYEMDEDERVWLCKQKLLEDGIDIEKWGEN